MAASLTECAQGIIFFIKKKKKAAQCDLQKEAQRLKEKEPVFSFWDICNKPFSENLYYILYYATCVRVLNTKGSWVAFPYSKQEYSRWPIVSFLHSKNLLISSS